MSSASFDLESFIIEISQENSIWNLGKYFFITHRCFLILLCMTVRVGIHFSVVLYSIVFSIKTFIAPI